MRKDLADIAHWRYKLCKARFVAF